MTTACRIERLADDLPRLQRGLDAPDIRFVRACVDAAGDELFADNDEYCLLGILVPVRQKVLIDNAAAVDIVAWWPDIAERVGAAFAAYDPSGLVEQTHMPPETDLGPRALWVRVMLPLPKSTLAEEWRTASVREILSNINEAVAYQVREYQVACRLEEAL